MTSRFTARTHLPAVNLLRDYIKQHSRHALTGDLAGRHYAIAHYSCPEQLGNRMMGFLNAFLAAVVTNRTVLWSYCHRDPEVCPMSGPLEECERVYRRREWIASTDEMLPTLGHPARRPAYPARLELARRGHCASSWNRAPARTPSLRMPLRVQAPLPDQGVPYAAPEHGPALVLRDRRA